MESPQLEVPSHGYAEARHVMSNCWIYTPERGLRAVTMHGNGSAIAMDGRRLQRWCIFDDALPRSIVAYVYSVEKPSPELREEVVSLSAAR
jgi:hypothetical protein